MRLINACALQEEYKALHGGKRLLLIDVAPTVDAVPVGAYRQVQWERDIAMKQLDALGYGLGEKVVPVVRCKDCKWWHDWNGECYGNGNMGYGVGRKADDFCNWGERKDAVD